MNATPETTPKPVEQQKRILDDDSEPRCPRCCRVILAGGCPYGHTDCPQFEGQTDV